MSATANWIALKRNSLRPTNAYSNSKRKSSEVSGSSATAGEVWSNPRPVARDLAATPCKRSADKFGERVNCDQM